MNFDLSDEQKMLGEQARALLADLSPFDRLRGLIDSGAEWDEPLWRALAEMGFLGAAIPEDHGGLGLGALDLGVILEALGGANAAVRSDERRGGQEWCSTWRFRGVTATYTQKKQTIMSK